MMKETRSNQRTLLQVPENFLRQFPSIKSEKAQKLYDRYLESIRIQIASHINYKECYHFSLEKAFTDCGDFYYNRVRYYTWSVFNKLQPIIQVLEKGNNMTNKLSIVRASDEFIELLLNTKDTTTLLSDIWCFSQASEDSDVKYIPIDEAGLRHYIAATTAALALPNNIQYVSKLKRNLQHAKQILLVSNSLLDKKETNTYCWPHIEKPSPYGRIYHYGLSLQNVSKEVRQAAIGKHYQYDLVAAIYAVKLMIAETIAATEGDNLYGLFTHTKQYVDQKSPIRKQLAKHIRAYPDGEKLIKEAMTAIGFGAKLKDITYTVNNETEHGAISSIIKNKEDRARFYADPWIMEFAQEQEDLTKYIVAHFVHNEEFIARTADVPDMKTNTGKYRPNQVMAYVYQHMETQIMKQVTEHIPVLCYIHDAFITVRKVDIIELRTKLRDISEYLHIECEEFAAYRTADINGELAEHEEVMRITQQLAEQRYGKLSDHHTKKELPQVPYHKEFYDGDGYDGTGNYDRDLDPFYDDDNDE